VAELVPCLWVLAGCNGAGKSSIGGAMLRESGGDYFNPDEVAAIFLAREPTLAREEANARAWAIGLGLIDDAIRLGKDHFFETTLGGQTIAGRLQQALETGHEVRIWFVGLDTPERHLARVAARVHAGGHPIPEADIRRRYDTSRRHLVELLPHVTELKLFDNSAEADPKLRKAPKPKLLLHWRERRIVAPKQLARTPDWAKPIVAQAIKSRGRPARR
jgi:predicted ABC-type ATPase